MADVTIRPERATDYERIAEVVEAAFEGPAEVRLVERIRASEFYVPELALVAEVDGVVVAHAMLSYVTLHGTDEEWQVLQLAPVAVVTERQRSGLGGAVVQACIDGAEARGEPLVMVQGHPEYYPRFGFERASRHGIEPPSPEQRDAAFMVRMLSAWNERYRGRIEYSPAFEGTS